MTDQPADRDRLRAAFATTPDNTVASGNCPSDETIWQPARGKLDTPALERVLDHTTSCEACAESWRMARTLGHEAGIRKTGKLLTFPPRLAVVALGAVAATILLVFFVAPTLDDRSVPPGEFRDPSSVSLESLLDETKTVSVDGLVLRWTGGPIGSLYTVELADENLAVLVRSEPQESTEYTVPADVLDGVPAGSTLYWRVEAILPDATRASSGVFLLRLQ